jgi:putative transposase
MGLLFREVKGVLQWLGVDCCFQAVWTWKKKLAEEQSDPPMASPSRVAVNETQIEVDGETKWLHAAIDRESKLFLEVDVYSRRGTDPAAAFLHRLTEKHDVANTEFLVDDMGP